MHRRWEDATEHPLYNVTPRFLAQSCPEANEHLIGSLYNECEDGHNTIISHAELEYVERGQKLDRLGEYGPLRSSRLMASVGRGSTEFRTNFGMLLGGVFLASTYVFVDYKNNRFGLAPAVLGTTKPKIKKQCSKDISIPPANTSMETNSTSSSNSTIKAASTGLSSSDKIAIGVSIPAGVAGIATLLYMILQDRRKRKARKQKELREVEQLKLDKQRHRSEREENESFA